jgi:diguanylate cyclase (GGDEF)-like protein
VGFGLTWARTLVKILIADDDRDSVELLELLLSSWGHEAVSVGDGNSAWNALQAPDAPRLAILDWMMPGLEGPDICRRLRERGFPYVYVILLTARGGKNDIVVGLGHGADDYLAKPFDPDELHARLGTAQRILDLQDSLLATQKTLRFDATHDHLTGVKNRAMIVERLRREMGRGSHAGDPTVVVFADLDHFKKINDAYGHAIGDQVLLEAADRIRASIRPYDALGRYGGDEFLVVLHACDQATATALAERIRERVAAVPVRTNGPTIALTVSLGVAAGTRQDCGPAALIAAADAALYRAKAEGRNRVAVATDDEIAAAATSAEQEPAPPASRARDRPRPGDPGKKESRH